MKDDVEIHALVDRAIERASPIVLKQLSDDIEKLFSQPTAGGRSFAKAIGMDETYLDEHDNG